MTLLSHTDARSLRTCDNCGLFQLTGTRALDVEPEEVEDVLLVTAITFAFPFLPAALCWPPYLFPMMGVYTETNAGIDSASTPEELSDVRC